MHSIDNLSTTLKNKLDRLDRINRLRALPHEQELPIDVSHNDYLDLANLDWLQDRLRASIGKLPLGGTSSRLVTEAAVFRALESEFAVYKEAEAALFFSSGYAANQAVILALSQSNTTFFYDSEIHASLIDGLRESPVVRSRKHKYCHDAKDQLRSLLEGDTAKIKVIITESLFSMSGYQADLKYLKGLADSFGALLVIDEAHTVGIVGRKGSGAISHFGLDHQALISINPCGKGLGAQGAFVAGPQWFIDFLINTARTFIYTTCPSPWLASGLRTMIALSPALLDQRRILWTRCHEFSELLRQQSLELPIGCLPSVGPIFRMIVGSDDQTQKAQAIMREFGIRCAAIRPPTVANDCGQLRISLHAGLTTSQIQHIAAALRAVRKELCLA